MVERKLAGGKWNILGKPLNQCHVFHHNSTWMVMGLNLDLCHMKSDTKYLRYTTG
jgi:hypothetical protein